MQDSIYKFMKVGLIHFMAYPQVMKGEGPILETLQKIAEDDFFTAVEVSWIKDAKVREKAKKLLEVSHLTAVSYTHLRAHETRHDLVCRLLLEKKKKQK